MAQWEQPRALLPGGNSSCQYRRDSENTPSQW